MNRRALLKALCASAPAAVVAALVGPKALGGVHTGEVVVRTGPAVSWLPDGHSRILVEWVVTWHAPGNLRIEVDGRRKIIACHFGIPGQPWTCTGEYVIDEPGDHDVRLLLPAHAEGGMTMTHIGRDGWVSRWSPAVVDAEEVP